MNRRLSATRLARMNPSAESITRSASLPTMQQEVSENMVDEYARIFRRHRLTIAAGALIGLMLGLLVAVPVLPRYTTRTSLDIRSLNNDFMDMRSVDPTGNSSAADNDINLQTQIKLLQSDSLMTQVSEKMLAAPHPAVVLKQDMLSRALRAVHLGGPESISYATLVSDAASHVKVKPLGLSRLVEVSCESYDASFSASFCNELTTTFEQEDLKVRAAEAEKTSTWLTRQLADVRQKAEDSQRKLEDAVGGNGLMLSQEATSAGEERLRALQDELTKAQADRFSQEAQAGVAKAAPADTLAGVQDNPEHRADELRLADLKTQLAQVVPALTEKNPKVMRLRSQIAEAESDLSRTQNTSTQRLNNDFTAAKHREDLLQLAYKAQESAVSTDLQKASQVSLLRKDVDAEQQLYQTLSQRAKEAGFAAAMQAATIRVVDPAETPKVPSSPRTKISGGVGCFLGGVCGLVFAFFRERSSKVFRAPGDVPRLLNVQELGVIPAAERTLHLRPTATLVKLNASTDPARPQQHGEVIALTRWSDSFSISAEAYRNATLSILLADSNKRSRAYIVTSPSANEGKTTVASNLGIALSKSHLRVVLVDGDLRRPSLHRAFGLENHFGVRDVLRGEVDLNSIPTEILASPTSSPNVSLVPSGRGDEDAVELLHSVHFTALLARLRREFDVVLVDTPPVLHMADARIMAGQSDGAILVLRAGQTSFEQAADVRDLFDRDGVRLVGTLLNDFNPSRDGRDGYYSSYRRYEKSAHAGAA